MKICVISTTIMTCPPAGYSGLEMLAWLQARGLSRKGHNVMLIAPGGSTPPDGVELHGTTLGESEQAAWGGYKDRIKDYDVVIDNSWQKWMYISKVHGAHKGPVLGILHAPVNTMYGSPPPITYPCLVAISKDQADHASEIWGCVSRVCYNGVDLDFYKALEGAEKNGRYLFLARMSTIKGPHIAVDIGRKLRIPLDLVGDDTITGEPGLVHRLRDQAKHNIAYIGPLGRDKTVEYFSTRKLLLHMNKHYREPFGLAPVEAMACGMPVIAFDNGAMRETIKHGETGFVVKEQEEVEKLIKDDATKDMKPEALREWAAQFSIQNMIDRYEELCKEAIETGGW